jgi:threonyl-tRNA synthetase
MRVGREKTHHPFSPIPPISQSQQCFWHSSAHVLGEALESTFGVQLTIGPPVEEGFYYDCYSHGRPLGEPDFAALDTAIARITKEKQAFQRVVVTRDEALALFDENPFKQEIIGGLAPDATISVYRCGPMVDLCTGPHLPNTGYVKAGKVTAASSAFWRGDAKNPALQRVYGVTFPDKAALAAYEHRIAEAKKRDHRVVGATQDLIHFHPLSPGSAFFMPHGARIYTALVAYIRGLYWRYEFEEVISPNLYNMELWHKSGHATHYKENMFCLDVEKAEFGLKPMNCPGHCLLFDARGRSYRDLPVRMADFGVLHRNEYSGALSGLTRVRRFQQDDAHIFCRPDQVGEEVRMCLAMLDEVYGVFGLDYEMALSTRPEKFMGEVAQWDEAEAALRAALDATGRPWEMNEGDGAFYGPKIDIRVFDALRRKFQCATIQLDFQLPIR